MRCDGFKYVLLQFGYMHTSVCLPLLVLSSDCFCSFRVFLDNIFSCFSVTTSLAVTSKLLLLSSNSSVVNDNNVSSPGSSTYIFGSSQKVLLGSSIHNCSLKITKLKMKNYIKFLNLIILLQNIYNSNLTTIFLFISFKI